MPGLTLNNSHNILSQDTLQWLTVIVKLLFEFNIAPCKNELYCYNEAPD